MYAPHLPCRRLIALSLFVLLFANFATANDVTTLSKEQIMHFLLTAKIIASKQSAKGITHPWRLTLSDGTITHDACFQPINEFKSTLQFANGDSEVNFVDSYKYNLAAYSLAERVPNEELFVNWTIRRL
jgi:hypothetical protein